MPLRHIASCRSLSSEAKILKQFKHDIRTHMRFHTWSKADPGSPFVEKNGHKIYRESLKLDWSVPPFRVDLVTPFMKIPGSATAYVWTHWNVLRNISYPPPLPTPPFVWNPNDGRILITCNIHISYFFLYGQICVIVNRTRSPYSTIGRIRNLFKVKF